MLRRVLNLLDQSIFGRTVGSLSCVVGLLWYALSSSSKTLFGEWNPTKIVLYIILSSIISILVLFEAKSRVSVVYKLKPHVEFLVLMLTSLYSFFADRSTKGKPDTWSVVSSVAFALTSLCLSRQIKPGFDVGLFSFFLGCVTVQLMKIHLIFILMAAGFCYPLVVLGSYSESQSDNGDSRADELKGIRIDAANRASFGMGQDKLTCEKLPEVEASEQLLRDLQEPPLLRQRRRQPQPLHQEQHRQQEQRQRQQELQCQHEQLQHEQMQLQLQQQQLRQLQLERAAAAAAARASYGCSRLRR
ncbi:hypothetical protein QN277_016493 [Acacia crassicarpa]|uniref:Uncharacterized protein n=1 Tax=Acacia crassicarpa TaxID=499986 RepID=A0AAE1MWR7_9FABA|nr:hypothetical protein QN277_016493 [Acacia crassicarpa]